jgi:hypothetical protein
LKEIGFVLHKSTGSIKNISHGLHRLILIILFDLVVIKRTSNQWGVLKNTLPIIG